MKNIMVGLIELSEVCLRYPNLKPVDIVTKTGLMKSVYVLAKNVSVFADVRAEG